MTTKAELEKELKELKTITKDLIKENKSLKKQLDSTEINKTDYTDLAASIVNIDGVYKLVKIGYNIENNIASILEVGDAAKNNRDLAISAFELKKFIEEKIIGKHRELWKN